MGQGQIALYLAIYGAILSTVAIFWNIRRDIRDRAEIKVRARLVKQWIMDNINVEYIRIELANTGRRPITVTEAYYRIGEREFPAQLSNPQDLPKVLEEGAFGNIDILKEPIEDLQRVVFFIAKDADEKKYFSKKYPLKTM